MLRTLLICLAITFTTPALSEEPVQGVATLPSGEKIKVLSMGPWFFSEGDPALRLTYETNLSMDDKMALEKEIAELWISFRKQAERSGYKNIILSASEPAGPGVITRTRLYSAVYQRKADGTWSKLEKKDDR